MDDGDDDNISAFLVVLSRFPPLGDGDDEEGDISVDADESGDEASLSSTAIAATL